MHILTFGAASNDADADFIVSYYYALYAAAEPKKTRGFENFGTPTDERKAQLRYTGLGWYWISEIN